jgi:hypothetical protein
MNRRQLLTNGVAGMAAVVAANAVTARVQAGNNHNLVGSWLGTITATNPPLGQFNDLISFHPGGVVTESRRYSVPGTPLGNLLETTGHGAWGRKGENTFEAFFRFLLQDADTGAALGTDNIRLSLTLDRLSDTLTGTFESQIKDTADTILLTVTGDYSATPITI